MGSKSELLRTLVAASSGTSFAFGVQRYENGAPPRINITNMCRRSYYSRNALHRRSPPPVVGIRPQALQADWKPALELTFGSVG